MSLLHGFVLVLEHPVMNKNVSKTDINLAISSILYLMVYCEAAFIPMAILIVSNN